MLSQLHRKCSHLKLLPYIQSCNNVTAPCLPSTAHELKQHPIGDSCQVIILIIVIMSTFFFFQISIDRQRLNLQSQHLRFPLLRRNHIPIFLHALDLMGHYLFMPTQAEETHRIYGLNNSDVRVLPWQSACFKTSVLTFRCQRSLTGLSKVS